MRHLNRDLEVTGICPNCDGFCGDCRLKFGGSDSVYRRGGIPFHLGCGPWRNRTVIVHTVWAKPENCAWDLCQRLRTGNAGPWEDVPRATP